jgi:hypothetical protein
VLAVLAVLVVAALAAVVLVVEEQLAVKVLQRVQAMLKQVEQMD